MPSQSDSDVGRRCLVAAGTVHYESALHSDLHQVPEEVRRVVASFVALGYERRSVVLDPDARQLRGLFADVKRDVSEEDIIVAYYTGHGERGTDRFYLLTRESNSRYLSDTALAAEELARALTEDCKASQILVILDTCYAGAGSADVAQIANRLTVTRASGVPAVFVIAAARPKQEAEQGALSLAVEQALANRDERLGGRVQPFLAVDQVMEEVNNYLKQRHSAQVATWSCVNVRGLCRLFPNPQYRPDIHVGLDLEMQRAFTEHWVPKARGAELGAGGWYFTGREQALREIAAWLGEPDSGGQARVVTGAPGSGKSALLARIVTLADPGFRNELFRTSGSASFDPSTLPPEGIVSVAVHARRKVLGDVVAQVARALHLSVRDPGDLVKALAGRSEKTVIVLDALDEADDKNKIISRFLLPLLGMPQIFLLIGVRPDSTDGGKRFRALGQLTVEIDLDKARYIATDDVARYAERRLLATEEPGRASEYRKVPEIARTVARAISRRSKGVFLIAHTVVLALLAKPSIIDATRPGWADQLPTGLDDAFESFLGVIEAQRPDGLTSAMVRAVLVPLAFSEGEGLPWGGIWAAVATKVSGMRIQDSDISLVRKHAAAFIVEALETDSSVYRLYHERLAQYLRDSDDSLQTQKHIVEALRSRVPVSAGAPGPDWIRAHAYVLAHLSSHALHAGLLDELVIDGFFLVAADPVRTLEVLSRSTDSFARQVYASYALAFHHMREAQIEDRLSYLEMAARQLGDDTLADMWTRRRRAYRFAVPWVRWLRMSSHRIIQTANEFNFVAQGALNSRSLVVSAGRDGTVRFLDLSSGLPLGEPLAVGALTAISVATLDTRGLLVLGGQDGNVRVWDIESGRPSGEPLSTYQGAVESVASATLDGRPVIVSGGHDGTVRVWDLASRQACSEPLRGHQGGVEAVYAATVEGQGVIVSGGQDGTVRLWDLASGRPRAKPLRGHDGMVASVSAAMLGAQGVVVSGGYDGTVRVWDFASGQARAEPLRGHQGRVTSVSTLTLEGQGVIVSGGWDGTIRLWDIASGQPRAEPFRGHEGGVVSVSAAMLDGHPVIVSGGYSDGTVRVWDLRLDVQRRRSLRGHEENVRSITIGTLEDRSLVIWGAVDGSVQIWDLASGEPFREALRGHDGAVNAVAMTSLDGQPLIVSAGDDGTLRVWDLASGRQRGKPLRGHKDSVESIAISTLAGRPVIVSGGSDETLRVWDLYSGRSCGRILHGNGGFVSSIAAGTIESRPVIVAALETGVRVWDLATGRRRGKLLRGHFGAVTSVAIGTFDGQRVIVSTGYDGTVRVWDLASGRPRGDPLRGNGAWASIAVGKIDNQTVIVSGSSDRTLRIWDSRGQQRLAVDVGTQINAVACGDRTAVVAACESGLVAFRVRLQ